MRWARALLAWTNARWIPLAHILLCIAIISPISLRPGWPAGHDVYPMFERVEAFRREFLAGNLVPLWTPFSFNGHGSPMPLLYHRLFNTVGGLFAVVFGTVRAVKLAIVLALVVGAFGMSASAREMGCPPWMRFWSGGVLLLAPYTFTDWLVRGAAAELVAGMLVPWLIVACLRVQLTKPFGIRMGAVLVLLFYAHSVILLYSLLLVAIALACYLIVHRHAPSKAFAFLARGIGCAAAITIAAVLPYAATIVLVGRDFNLHRLSIYLPQHELVRVSRYFIDNFPWGHDWRGFSVEIGRFFILALIAAVGAAVVKRAYVPVQISAFLGVSAFAYFLFQLPIAATFFELLPISQVLQFPWRLLVFITPLVILLLAAFSHAVFRVGSHWAYGAVAILAGVWAAQASFAVQAEGADYEWLSPETLRLDLTKLDSPFGAGEFLPEKIANRPVPPRSPLFQLEGCELVSSSVDFDRLETVPFETVDLALTSANGCRVHFSQFLTALVETRAGPAGHVLKAEDETTEIVLPAGATAVRIQRRGIFRTLAYFLSGLGAG